MYKNRSRTIGERLLLLRDYVCSHADATHAVRADDIITYLANHNLEVAIKTVYSDLNALKCIYDLDLEYSEKHKGYILKNPPFEANELRWIIDSLQASKFLTQAKAQQITSKIIRHFGNERTAAELNRQSYVSDRIRSMNESVVTETDRLHDAIRNDKKIGFYYFHYTPQKEKQYSRKGDRYVVSPYAMLWDNGNYYLYAYDGKKFRYFRVDRMERISLPLPEPREGKDQYRAKNITKPKSKVFQMYSGKECNVRMRFRSELTDSVMDQFGREVMLIPDDSEHFILTAWVELSPPFYAWLASFGRKAKIVAPEEAVAGMKTFLERASMMYEEDRNT